jgi:hypothetical protein
MSLGVSPKTKAPPPVRIPHDHARRVLTLNRTPGISPTACPDRPNPAISTSSWLGKGNTGSAPMPC